MIAREGHLGPMERGTRSLAGVAVASLLAVAAFLVLLELRTNAIPLIDLPALLGPSTGIGVDLAATVLALTLVWLVLHTLGRFFERVTAPRFESHAHARSVWRIIAYVVWFFVLLTLALAFVGNAAFAALGLGLFGAALAFVLQKPLLNLVGWVAITYQRLYRIGDRIAVGEARGYVVDIRIMHTELREFGGWMQGDTFSGRILSIPNGLVFDLAVYNYTKDVPFVWDEVGNLVTYESDIDVAKRYMLEAATEVVGSFMETGYRRYLSRLELRDIEGLLLRRPEVRMEFKDSGVQMYVIYFCAAEQRRRAKSEITERIWRKFGADPTVGIAYPHVEVVRGTPRGDGSPPDG